ncbi:GNAT family N-acetyltransferase [Planomonospora corallina]|uniref:GNAT family N-acetyltransferase n=1 Tax=Planomonospora corallina TaxID=1806052 RepID=A0ABV8I1T2_9ACTN
MGRHGAAELRAEASPLESARFGCSVARLTVPAGHGSLAPVREALLASDADVVVLRYPAENVGWFAHLASDGRVPLFAGSLVYWSLPAGRGRRPAPAGGLRTAALEEPETVSALVAGIFAEYGNHYAANPLFDGAAALSGYREWAAGAAEQGRCLALWAEGGAESGAAAGAAGGGRGEVLGLATVADDGPRTEILLAGMVPAARGRGLYAHLLRAVEDRALGRGAAEVVISTQEHNTRVQRAWARYGFRPSHAVLTVHMVRSGLLCTPGRPAAREG